jgi:hypothetical protein
MVINIDKLIIDHAHELLVGDPAELKGELPGVIKVVGRDKVFDYSLEESNGGSIRYRCAGSGYHLVFTGTETKKESGERMRPLIAS